MARVSIWVCEVDQGDRTATLIGEPLLDYDLGIADSASFQGRLFAVSPRGKSDLGTRELGAVLQQDGMRWQLSQPLVQPVPFLLTDCDQTTILFDGHVRFTYSSKLLAHRLSGFTWKFASFQFGSHVGVIESSSTNFVRNRALIFGSAGEALPASVVLRDENEAHLAEVEFEYD